MHVSGRSVGRTTKGRGVILLLIPSLKIKLFLLAVSGLFPSKMRQKHLKIQDKTFFFAYLRIFAVTSPFLSVTRLK